MLSSALLMIAGVGLVSSTVFLLLAAWAALRHIRRSSREPAHGAAVPVSVLKPVHGMEPRLRENLETFFRQDHADFELLFCARSLEDPAMKLVEELCQTYPQVRVRRMASGEPPCPNAKVHSLEKLVAAAQHELLVISDSDVAVAPGYLREVVRPLVEDERIGMVTCLYRGVPIGGLWSRLEALGMSVEMTSGALIAEMLEGVKFALGPTMATRKRLMAALGGVAQLGDYCADDFVLGSLVHAAGYRVMISSHVIEHVVVNRSLPASWRHQVRWMKSTRRSRPRGHLGAGLTFAMPYGILGLGAAWAAGAPWLGLGMMGWAYLNRVVQSMVVGYGVVRDRHALRSAWLYPLRDLLGFLLWLASYTGRVIEWRGERYRLQAGGKMARVDL